MTNDYFPKRSPRGETRTEAVKRINEDYGIPARTDRPPMSAEERAKIQAYLERHDERFGLEGRRIFVGDEEGDADVS